MHKNYTVRQRILGFGLAILLLVTLAACGKAAETRNNAPAATPAPETAPETAANSAAETSAPATEGIAESGAPGFAPVDGEFEYAPSLSGKGGEARDAYTGFYDYSSGSLEGPAYEPGGSAAPAEPAEGEPVYGDDDGDLWIDPVPGENPVDAQPFVLTAGEWNDNANWPFFVNLVRSGAITFPAFGLDPTNRIVVKVQDETGAALANETVTLYDEAGEVLWTSQTGKTGTAYLFFRAEQKPDRVAAAGAESTLTVTVPDETGQGTSTVYQTDEVTLTGTASAARRTNLQVMFIVDTTGSMGDEIIYLQKDFSSIAEDVGNDGVSYSACFYRDEGDVYVTRCNGFTSDIAAVQALINAEYADGGGDTPEAVAQILKETLSDPAGWTEDSVKIAFLIFDAPPHYGTDEVLDRAIRDAAARGIHVIPVVASNADRETELFGRALAICTDGTYVFLTDDSGVGGSHLEPIIGDYEVEKLHDVIVRIIDSYRVD